MRWAQRTNWPVLMQTKKVGYLKLLNLIFSPQGPPDGKGGAASSMLHPAS